MDIIETMNIRSGEKDLNKQKQTKNNFQNK